MITKLEDADQLGFESFIPATFGGNYGFSLIIPAYNEADRIGIFLKEIVNNLNSFKEVIVVCDGSDDTAEIARKFVPRVRVLEFNKRLGKGGAIIEGFKVAKSEIIGYVDADGAVPWYEIERIFSMVSIQSPVVVGSRWVNGSRIIKKQPFARIILGRLYHYLTFAILGLNIKDTQCGMKVYERDVVETVLKKLQLRNLSVDTAFLYHCKKEGYPIRETPIEWTDVGGSKFSPIKSASLMFVSLIAIRVFNSRFSRFFNSLEKYFSINLNYQEIKE